MPEIARFYGIVISMYFFDHAPPHLHARYGRAEAMFRLADAQSFRGELPPTARELVREWILAHRHELDENWRLVAAGNLPQRVPGPDGRE